MSKTLAAGTHARRQRRRSVGKVWCVFLCVVLLRLVNGPQDSAAVATPANELPAADSSKTPDRNEAQPPTGDNPIVSSAEPILWLPMTPAIARTLFGDDGVQVLERINAVLPSQLNGASSLLQSSSVSPGTAVMKQALLRAGVSRILSSLQLLMRGSDAPAENLKPTPSVDVDSDEVTYTPADWIANPGLGQTVVHSEFEEATVSAESALREPITTALKLQISRLAERELDVSADWQKLVDITVSDEALRQFIVTTDTLTEVIPTIDGSKPMRKTYALVEFPETIEKQLLNDVRTAVRENRTAILCLCIAALWFGIVLLSFAARISQHSSVFRRITTIPVITLLILPSVLISLSLLGNIVSGDVLLIPAKAGHHTSLVRIDHVQSSKSPTSLVEPAEIDSTIGVHSKPAEEDAPGPAPSVR